MTTFDEAYDLTGHGRFNYLALFTNGFILLYVTVECLGLGFVLNKADCDLSLTTQERGSVAAATFIGVVAPAIIWGYLGDKYGRRKTMLPATILAVLFSIASSLSVNYMSMFVLRIITGAMISASCATAYVYLGELTSPAKRATCIAWGSFFIAGSYIAMPVSAGILLPLNFSVHVGSFNLVPWRVLMWAFTIWGSTACVGMAILPESPAFLLSTKGSPEALAVLAKIYACNQKKTADEYPIKEIESPPVKIPTFKESISRMKYMVKKPLLKCVIISHICNFMVFMQSNAFYVWLPHVVDELLKHAANSPNDSMCRILNLIHKVDKKELSLDECKPVSMNRAMYPIATLVGIITATIYIGIGIGMKRWGKQLIYAVIMCTCATLLIMSAVIPSPIAAIVLFIPGVCGIAANTVLAAAIVEIFPTNLRAVAMGTLFMVGRLGAAVGSNSLAWGLTNSCVTIVLLICIFTSYEQVARLRPRCCLAAPTEELPPETISPVTEIGTTNLEIHKTEKRAVYRVPIGAHYFGYPVGVKGYSVCAVGVTGYRYRYVSPFALSYLTYPTDYYGIYVV